MLTAGHDDVSEIRDAVRELCERFPGNYWRGSDGQKARYPPRIADLAQHRLGLPRSY